MGKPNPKKRDNTQIITLDLVMSEILTKWPETISIFLDYQMTCVGCYMSSFDTLDDALSVHGLPKYEVVEALNKMVHKEKSNKMGRLNDQK